MTLLSAISMLREDLPIIVITRDDEKHVEALAYANGAAACFPEVPRPHPDAGEAVIRITATYPNGSRETLHGSVGRGNRSTSRDSTSNNPNLGMQ